ncbi:MAG: RsmG family class I SAM-dependent methyltransferase [Balneolaceae bacterium]|nr:RsmG family class I SAM-dependent methyltransferase [Balneolaceae bacterium]
MKQTIPTYQDAPSSLFTFADELLENNSDALDRYLERLLWWNERVNLVSRAVPRETLREHIRHSLAVSGLEPFQQASTVVDAGTGGGLPGIPLSVANPDKSFVLNDIVTKKILAVRQMARNLGLSNIRVADCSLADLEHEKPFVLLSKHSFKLDEILELSTHLPWTHMILYKGEELAGELDTLAHSPSLTVQVLRLHKASQHPFYEGKALVVVRRENH